MMQPERGFARSEFEARTAAAQTRMKQLGLSGLLLMTEPEVRYFTGFHTLFWQSPTRPWFVFLPVAGDVVAVIPEIGAEVMRRTWVKDIRTWNAPQPQDDGLSLLRDLLAPMAKSGEKIAILQGHETILRMPLGDYRRLVESLPGLVWEDGTGLVRGLRMVKSEAEIEKLRYISKIGSQTFAQVPQFAGEGMALEEVFRSFRRAGLGNGADDAPYVVGGADQGGYHDVISPPTKRPLARGDILMLDTGMTWDGYFCDFDRNWSVGPPDAASKRAYDVLWRATEVGMEAARPGATCRDIYHAIQNVTSELAPDGGDVGRFGHGLGMQLTEWPSIASWDETVIEENMVLTIEPSLSYGDGRVMVHEENIVVRSTGAELLTERAPSELPSI